MGVSCRFRFILWSTCVVFLGPRALGELSAPVWAPDAFGGYASTHILVKFHRDLADVAPAAAEGRRDVGELLATRAKPVDPSWRAMEAAAQTRKSLQSLSDLSNQWAVQAVRAVHARVFRNPMLARSIGLDRTYRIEVPVGTNTLQMVAVYATLDAVEFAELDGIGGVASLIPNDSDFSLQWGMNNTGQSGGAADADVDAIEAWELHTGDPGSVTVAIVDSGVDPHVDYNERLITGINATASGNPNDTSDSCLHGTHVAGIAAATGDNAEGVAGMTWGANILPVRVLNGCSGTESDCAAGIEWAADNGADICNMSLQYYLGTQTLKDAVDYAHGLGVLLIAAAGNNHGGTVAFPARFDNCMAVSGTNHNDQLLDISNWGDELDVSAPGDNIWSTWSVPANTYRYLDGTSMATPHVAGLAALMMSYVPTATAELVWDTIVDTADDIGAPGWDDQFGAGRINAYDALVLVDERDPISVCCNGTGGCSVSRASLCAGAWTPGDSCDPNLCPVAPIAWAAGSRYLGIDASPLGADTPVAIRVTSVELPCVDKYVAESGGVASLTNVPVYQTAAEWGTVLFSGPDIIPEVTYRVHAELEGGFAGFDEAMTWAWADTNQSGSANIGDVQFIILGFQGNFSNAALEAVDLWPCTPNGNASLDDAQQAILAFQGQEYTDTFCNNLICID